MTKDFTTKSLEVRRSWNDVFYTQKVNNCQPKLLGSIRLSFTIERERKFFQGKHKLCEFLARSHYKKYLKESYIFKRKINPSKKSHE